MCNLINAYIPTLSPILSMSHMSTVPKMSVINGRRRGRRVESLE